MKILIHVDGLRPMLQHNGRLANPLDPYTQRLKQLTAKRKKTDEDLMAILVAEARGAVYETSDGLLGFPTQNVWKAIYTAATAFKQGENIKRALSFEDSTEPLLFNGAHISVEKFLADPVNIDYRPVAVNRAKTMRARPKVQLPWAATYAFELLDDVIDARDLAPILERAGRLVGLGDWRPIYGTFAVEVES